MKISLNYNNKAIKLEKYASNSIIEVPDKCTVRDMISLLGLPKNLSKSITVWVNGEITWNSTILKDGDSIKLITSIGGG